MKKSIDAIEHRYLITHANRKYLIDLDKLKEVCMLKDKESENEITTTYETNDEGDLTMTAKLLREVKSIGNAQNDMVVYDVVKMFIGRLLENQDRSDIDFQVDFSTALAFNTLLGAGILIEVE